MSGDNMMTSNKIKNGNIDSKMVFFFMVRFPEKMVRFARARKKDPVRSHIKCYQRGRQALLSESKSLRRPAEELIFRGAMAGKFQDALQHRSPNSSIMHGAVFFSGLQFREVKQRILIVSLWWFGVWSLIESREQWGFTGAYGMNWSRTQV